jgi:hypothetical protein
MKKALRQGRYLFDRDSPLLAGTMIVRAGAASASTFQDFVGRDVGGGARSRR